MRITQLRGRNTCRKRYAEEDWYLPLDGVTQLRGREKPLS
jgi:hypothetical protein